MTIKINKALLQQAGRFVRVSAGAAVAQLALSWPPSSKTAWVSLIVGALETAYRQVRPLSKPAATEAPKPGA